MAGEREVASETAGGGVATPQRHGGPVAWWARFVPYTLAGRLAVTFAVAMAIVMALLAFALARGVETAYVDRLGAAMTQEATLVALLAAEASPESMAGIARTSADVLAARVVLIGPDGSVLGDSFALGDVLPDAGPVRRSVPPAGVGTADYLWVAIEGRGGGVSTVRIGRPLAEVDATIWRLQRLVLAATLLAIALVVGVGVFVAGRIGRPLADLRRQAAAVFDDRLDVAVQPASTRELGELGQAFNAMTARLRASLDELARTRGRLEATLASLSDGVAILDPRGTVVLLNPAAAAMLAADSTVGRPFVEVARDHELDALARTAAAAPEPAHATIQHGRSGRWIEAAAQRVETGDEDLVLVVLRDVTDLRRLENVRREFVANVSHELRTPLASIRAVVETLEAGAIDDHAVSYDFLRRIVGETDRLALLVDDLLDLARLQSGRVRLRLEPTPADQLVAHGVDRLTPQVERARLSLRLDLPDDLPVVRVDRARIEQVLLNLVHNAIKFTPAGGEIRVAAARHDGGLEIAVSDNGIGVAADELPRLFERFYKADKARRSDGTGLGLAIAKHIVLAHGGTIAAESTPGVGSTFTVKLPVNGPAPTDLPPASGGFPGTLRRLG